MAPSPEQHPALVATLERFNVACNAIADIAFRKRLANKIALQKLVYHDIRECFGLSSQMTVRAIAKVAEAYKRDITIQPFFRPHGALTYNERIMSWKGLEHVRLLTLGGRQMVACHFGPYQHARRDRLCGQADLILHDGAFYLYATVDVPEVPITHVQDFLGVDLGIVNIATDSDATVFTGERVDRWRRTFAHRRPNLQRKQTRSARRKLRSLRGKQASAPFQLGICSVEDLRAVQSGAPRGVRVILVDPSRARFECIVCAFAGPADAVAACVISARARAAVMRPNVDQLVAQVAEWKHGVPAPATSCLL